METKSVRSTIIRLVVILIILFTLSFNSVQISEAQQSNPGEGALISPFSMTETNAQSLAPVVSEYGKIKLSMDALGMMEAEGKIQVEKPTDGKLRKAFLLSATTGFTGYKLTSGDVKLNGNPVAWEKEIASSISSYNYWADVTNMVKPIIDGAPAGIVDLTLYETNSSMIDGEILVAIFDDPNQKTDNTVILYFGAQNVAGDVFTIDTGKEIDLDDENLVLDFSLGISYGWQGTGQYSTVDINGTRLTTSAGGQDDGTASNGALMTVGGVGDTNSNPADPNALPNNDPRLDDELYDLKPFVKDGDKTITVNTQNPSVDDNILFAALFLGATGNINAINLDVSLYNNPTTAEERAPYETIIRYFADGVFESSNGAHKLGKVTFHTNGAHSNDADIVWIQNCHPSANVAGFGTDGMHINMCDVFTASSNYNFLSDDAHQKGGGYTLAHEFGHYFYSLYDEYVGDKDDNDIFHFPHSTDKAVDQAIMNSQWNATNGDFDWLNFSTPLNDTKETAQYRVYEASGWTTLTRPVANDPRNGERASLPVRLFHEELESVKPEDGKSPVINLPGEARSELSITWDAAAPPPVAPFTVAEVHTLPISAQLTSINGQNISYPDPILLLAFAHRDLTITDLGIQGSVAFPDGSQQPVLFTDDGVAPDFLGGDGWYSAIINPNQNGLYRIDVTFDNNANIAKFVGLAFQPSLDPDGNPIPMTEPVLVNENFLLAETLYVSVSNTVSDDHANLPGEATAVFTDNTPVSGKFDISGDVDYFTLQTLASGATVVRIDNLAFGTTPYITVLASDQTTILYEGGSPSVLCSEYLNLVLDMVENGETIYIEVSDELSTAGGLYQVSAGQALASDTACRIYLPYTSSTP
jgi:hypothetical protein